MTRESRKKRLGLTFFYAGIIFCVNSVSLIVASIVAYFFSKLGWLERQGIETGQVGVLFIFLFIVGTIIGAILTTVTTKISVRPFNQIIEKTNLLAQGNYHVRLEFPKLIKSSAVFAELGESFNKLAEELEHTEIMRSDFINNFSHEFKTPIVSIAGFAKVLRKGILSENERQEYLKVIEEESLRLAAMTTNTLNLTKIESQTILTDITAFNVSEQIRSSVLLLEPQWGKKDIEWNLEFDEYDIQGNEELLKQVWINLLDNAIKFSPEKQEIIVQITDRPYETEVAIVNFGDEIPKDKRKRIFDRFYQAEESHTVKGNGVGLAVVKKIVGLHKGEVWVESGQEKTIFLVALPK